MISLENSYKRINVCLSQYNAYGARVKAKAIPWESLNFFFLNKRSLTEF